MFRRRATPQVTSRDRQVRARTAAFARVTSDARSWGDYSGYDHHQKGESWEDSSIRRRFEAEAAAKSANVGKQRGFYVDLNESDTILSPRDVSPDGISEDLQRAVQVVEMLLIRDHSRMKFDAVTDYESAHEQQFRLLPISHPEDFGVA